MGRFMLNGKVTMLNGNFVEYNNGTLLFYVRGGHFPYSNFEPPDPSTQNYNNSYFQIISSESNTATIDYGDGNVINYNFKSNQLLFFTNNLTETTTIQARHDYANTIVGDRIIRIKFSKPDKILVIKTQYVNLYAEFPSEISNLININEISINQSSLTKIPVSMASLPTLRKLLLSGIGTAIINRIPDEFLALKLESFIFSSSINLSDLNTSNFINFLNSENALTLKVLKIDNCLMETMPYEIINLVSIEDLSIGSGNLFETMPVQLNSLVTLKKLNIGADATFAPNIRYWSSVSELINLTHLLFGFANNLETTLPPDLENCTKLKNILCQNSFTTTTRINAFITNLYNFINTNASKTGLNTLPFRGMTINCINSAGNAPSGTFQSPTGYVAGVSNGTPASPKEMLWVLINQYGHTITYTA